nr:uncharacterized protein LOC131785930 [Pocillopora verrucosa]
MISRRQSIVLIMIILCSYTQAKLECPSKCHCADDFSVVICRGLEKFPVFGFASVVKTLDLTHGNIKHIDSRDVRAYSRLERLFINHNPLDCDYVNIYTLKHLKKTAGLKTFDGHKVDCPPEPSVMNDRLFDNNHHGHYNHHILSGGSPRFVFYHASFSQLAMAVGTVMVVLSVLTVAVVCCVLVCFRRKLSRGFQRHNLATEDPLSKIEKGTGNKSGKVGKGGKKCSKKQRKGPQGHPKRGKVNTDGSGEVEEVDYLKEKMRKQRRGSRGYLKNVKSDDSLFAEEEDFLTKNLKIQRSVSRGYAMGARSSDDD